MDVDKSRGAISKKYVQENTKEIRRKNEEDLLFEMEDEDFERERSKSIDSFCSQHTVGSFDSPVGESSRESSVAPRLDRPETLRIASVNRLRKEEFYGSLPQTRKQSIPSINFQFSVPAHNDPPWEADNSTLAINEYSSSLSSVEEATEENLTPAIHRSFRRRRSNNLDVSETPLVAKSPRFLPKFLRASFSKLISKDKLKTPVQRTDPMSLSFFGSRDVSRSQSLSMGHSDMSGESINKFEMEITNDIIDSHECSPTTKQFVEDSMAKGLPIIPFNYSTAEIIEKRLQMRKTKNCFQTSTKFDLDESATVKNSERKLSISPRRNYEEDYENTPEGKMEDKSLHGLLILAKKELEEEANERKISDITGYAANNSRALQRRRSSVTEYVGLSIDLKDKTIQGIQKNASIDKSLLRKSSRAKLSIHKHQENLKRKQTWLVDGDHEQSDENDEKITYFLRSVPSRANSIEQYLDMNCGLREPRNLI